MKLETTTIDDLGQADKIVIDKDNTIITGGKGSEANKQELLKGSQMKQSDYDRENFKNALLN